MSIVTKSHYKIFEYWKDKFINEDGSITTEPLRTDGCNKSIPVIFDWGETSCWACDKPFITHKEKTGEYKKTNDYKSIWSDPDYTSEVERCHIIPQALGGKDEVSNLFLMCPKCHELSPDTSNPSSFFRWVYNQRKTHCMGQLMPKEIADKLNSELEQRGIKGGLSAILDLLGKDADYHKAKEYVNKHSSSHFPKYAESSMICVFADFLCWLLVEESLKDVS